ncbi:MAG: hypothetical protein K0Q77_265 [Anaerosporomusa subterranea]|jgi:hypothetical protein|nr:hypothetical protein [Anaerosporomusa subterranea]
MLSKTVATVLGKVRGTIPRRSRIGKEGTEVSFLGASKAGKLDTVPSVYSVYLRDLRGKTQTRPIRKLKIPDTFKKPANNFVGRLIHSYAFFFHIKLTNSS